MKHEITKTQNGRLVYVDLIHSLAGNSIADHPYLLTLIKERLSRPIFLEPLTREEYDMGRTVGYDFVIETSNKDTILYARLFNETTYTRFIKNGKPTPTPYLSIELKQDPIGHYELLNTWIGRLSPPKPGDPLEVPQSKEYWNNHAVVLDKQRLQTRSVTKVCPY